MFIGHTLCCPFCLPDILCLPKGGAGILSAVVPFRATGTEARAMEIAGRYLEEELQCKFKGHGLNWSSWGCWEGLRPPGQDWKPAGCHGKGPEPRAGIHSQKTVNVGCATLCKYWAHPLKCPVISLCSVKQGKRGECPQPCTCFGALRPARSGTGCAREKSCFTGAATGFV